jgi:hypothetical protein
MYSRMGSVRLETVTNDLSKLQMLISLRQQIVRSSVHTQYAQNHLSCWVLAAGA